MNGTVALNPTVCVVGTSYQIAVLTQKDAIISIRVGEKAYYNHSNGIKRSEAGVHKITVPMAELDSAGEYTVAVRNIIERCPYFPKLEPEITKTYKFRPLTKTNDINIYHLADVHGKMEKATEAAKYVKKDFDLLILNGDIVNYSDTFESMTLAYKIASEIAKGEIPCIISRGNHDLRGAGAEKLADYMPGDNGRSYYTFRLGCIWGILLDSGEDKDDLCEEYGGTICCHDFRLEETEMFKNVVKNAAEEYENDGVKYKLVISHVPFSYKECVAGTKFDIENEIYDEWISLLKENVKPSLMLCGHTHKAQLLDNKNGAHPCPVIIGSDVKNFESDDHMFAGAYINLKGSKARAVLNTKDAVIGEYETEI